MSRVTKFIRETTCCALDDDGKRCRRRTNRDSVLLTIGLLDEVKHTEKAPIGLVGAAARELRAAIKRIGELENLANQACDWLEARTDKQARTFHAAHIRNALKEKP